jgi:hypothetical protein
LEKALTYDPHNNEIRHLHDSLSDDIQKQKKGEKRVFKSFFRNVNRIYEEQQKIVGASNPDIGKAEVKLLEM